MKHKWMKKITAVMLAVTLAIPAGIMLSGNGANAAGINLLANGTFDDNGAANASVWTDVAVATQKTTVKNTDIILGGDFENESAPVNWKDVPSYEAGVGRDGSRALVVTRVAGQNPYFHYDGNGTAILEAGKTYKVSYFAKSEAGVTWNHVLQCNDSTLNSWNKSGTQVGTSEWKEYSYEFTATEPAAAYQYVQIGLQFITGVGAVYIDDFSVTYSETELAVELDNQIQDGDIENETMPANWVDVPAYESGVGVDGSRAIVVTRAAGQNPYFRYDGNGTALLEAGQTYRVSYFAKSGDGVKWNHVLQCNDNTLNSWNKSETQIGTLEWKEYSYEFVATETAAAYKYVQVGFQFIGGTGTVYMDNFAISKVSPLLGDGLLDEDGDSDYELKLDEKVSVGTTIALEAGKPYEYEFDVKLEENSSVNLSVGGVAVKTVAAGEGWQTVKGVFTAATEGENAVAFTHTGVAYVDDVAIYAHTHTDVDNNEECDDVNCKADLHVHSYDQELTEVEGQSTLANGATCGAKATYYKSCVCGDISAVETFESGELAPHAYADTLSKDGTHHWYGATCEHTEEKKDYVEHTYDQELTEVDGESTLANGATCGAKATYYKSCICGAVSNADTFETGEVLEHIYAVTWSKDGTHHWHGATCEHIEEKTDYAEHAYDQELIEVAGESTQASVATCIEKATYFKSCVCGALSSIDTFEYGDFAAHTDTDEDGICDVEDCKKDYIPKYKVTEGAKGTYKQGSDDGLVIKADGAYKNFSEVKVDGKVVEKTNYTVKEGSTIVTLSKAYLDTLSVGEHALDVVYNDGGVASTTFTVEAKAVVEDTSSIATGDNGITIWLVMMAVSMAAFVAANFGRKEEEM